MKIETYELEEVSGEAEKMVADHEAMELIEKLGLEGQKTLSNKDTETRMPYPEMTEDQHFAYGVLFPKHVLVENYSAGIIPIRVLQVISFLKENKFFDEIKIWHSQGRKDKDPILVGYAKDHESTWSMKRFLIARWGDALLPFEEVMRQAKELAYNTLCEKTSKAFAEASMFKNTVDSIKNAQNCTIEMLQKSPFLHGT